MTIPMAATDIPWLVAALALAATLVQTGRLAWLRRAPGRRQRARLRRALRGEREAEQLLEARGFVIEARQAPTELVIHLDGAPVTVGVRVDLLVRRGSERYVAEVKTGKLAPRIQHAATRRQLLEYALAFDVDGVLLVDAEAGLVQRVEFPTAGAPTSTGDGAAGRLLGWLVAAALGAAAAAFLLT